MEPAISIDDLTIGQARKIAEMFPQPLATCHCHEATTANGLDDFAVGQSVIIRTYSARVWCGTLEKKMGKEVILRNARRMWRWWCAKSISLSGVVANGIIQAKSKIAPAVDSVWLEAIEILPITGEPLKSIMDAPDASAE